MACTDNIVSIRGLCDDTPALYYLDDIGLSLVTAAKAADEKYANGKQLVQRMIDLAWDDIFQDVLIDGFQANKVLNADTIGVYTTDTESGTGYKGLTFTLYDDDCGLLRFFLASVTLKIATGGHTIIRIISDGVTTELYNGTPDNNTTITKYFNDWVEDGFQVQVLMDNITVYTSTATTTDCDCRESTHYTYTGDTSGLQVSMQVKCDKERYLCQFIRQLGKPALYKAGAKIWKVIKDTNRFNDLMNIKKDDAVMQMAWLDSTYNLLKYDPNFDNKHYAIGMYQQELAKLKIPVPDCRCCLECEEPNQYVSVTLP